MMNFLTPYIKYIQIGALVALLAMSFAAAWHIQGLRLDALQGKYDTFVAQTESLGKQAIEQAKTKEAEDKLDKEIRDAEIEDLRLAAADYSKQLRDERDTNRRAMRKVRASISDPTRTCFRTAEFNAASERFDTGLGAIEERIQRLGDEGDDYRIALDGAKRKAQGLR